MNPHFDSKDICLMALAVIFWPLTLMILIFVWLAADESEEDRINRMNKGG